MLALARHGGQPRTWERETRTGPSKELDEPLYVWFSTFRTFAVSVLFGTPVRNPEQSHFIRVSLCLHQCSLLPDSTCRWMAQPSRTLLTNMHLTGSGREMTVFMSPMILPLPWCWRRPRLWRTTACTMPPHSHACTICQAHSKLDATNSHCVAVGSATWSERKRPRWKKSTLQLDQQEMAKVNILIVEWCWISVSLCWLLGKKFSFEEHNWKHCCCRPR